MTLYSAANGNWEPWAIRHISRFGVAVLIMLGLAMVNIRYYYNGAYAFYFITLFLLFAVEIGGHIGMGAQRWINLGLFKIQPSELMKSVWFCFWRAISAQQRCRISVPCAVLLYRRL